MRRIALDWTLAAVGWCGMLAGCGGSATTSFQGGSSGGSGNAGGSASSSGGGSTSAGAPASAGNGGAGHAAGAGSGGTGGAGPGGAGTAGAGTAGAGGRCVEGTQLPGDCNSCQCLGGQWACTDRFCPATCGGFAGDTCAANEYCAYVPGQACGAADASSICQTRPDNCTDIYMPVCGCDQKTYPSACDANGHGQGVYALGECPKVP